jgi:hypothetical protein
MRFRRLVSSQILPRARGKQKEVLDVLQTQYNKGAWDKETEIEPKVIGS